MEIGYGQMDVKGNLNLHGHCFGYVSFIEKKYIKHPRNFFETGHGKGEHDGAGACVKQQLQWHQMNHSIDRFVCADQVV